MDFGFQLNKFRSIWDSGSFLDFCILTGFSRISVQWMVSLWKLDSLVFSMDFIHSVWLSLDIGFGIAYRSYLTIQTYNSQVFNASAETLVFEVDVFTVKIVELRVPLS